MRNVRAWHREENQPEVLGRRVRSHRRIGGKPYILERLAPQPEAARSQDLSTVRKFSSYSPTIRSGLRDPVAHQKGRDLSVAQFVTDASGIAIRLKQPPTIDAMFSSFGRRKCAPTQYVAPNCRRSPERRVRVLRNRPFAH